MSAKLRERLDPVTYLPEPSQIDVSDNAYRLAESILHQTRGKMEYQHYGRSALAGAAVYVASVVVDNEKSVTQPGAAAACGTSSQSIRQHTEALAALARDHVDTPGLDKAAQNRLFKIADTGSVKGVKTWARQRVE